MTNLNTSVSFSEDFNKVTSDLLTDNTGQIVATVYHLSSAEKKEFAKRINKYPELVTLVMKLVDTDPNELLNSEVLEKLKKSVHNYSRKGSYK